MVDAPGGELANGGAVVFAAGLCGAPDRRRKARVPDGVPFQAKPKIALMLRDQARPERYVVGVRVDFRVSARRTSTGPVQRADQLLQRLPRWQWRTIRWRQGAKGWRRKKVIAVDLTAAITIVIPGPFAVGSPLGIPRSNSTKVAGRGRVFAKTAPVSSMS